MSNTQKMTRVVAKVTNSNVAEMVIASVSVVLQSRNVGSKAIATENAKWGCCAKSQIVKVDDANVINVTNIRIVGKSVAKV